MKVSMARLVALTIDGIFFSKFDGWRRLNLERLTVDAVIGRNLVQELGPVYMEVGYGTDRWGNMRRHGIEEPADAVFINPARYKYLYIYT